ncbi:MAG TPA: response regulator transcription factor, partial [Phenylobacterium sp.]|nr:response regulator transcription factor [Phenylobacterium sp.]
GLIGSPGLGYAKDRFAGEALQAQLRQETFDILLLDWNVPGLSGLELLAWIRRTLSPPPGVLMVTARNSAHDIVTALDAGADDFIVKPVDRAVLLARMSAVLRRLQSAESAADGCAAGRPLPLDRQGIRPGPDPVPKRQPPPEPRLSDGDGLGPAP